VVGIGLLFALVSGACGGDDDDDTSTADTPPADETADDAATSTSDAPPADESGDDEGTEASAVEQLVEDAVAEGAVTIYSSQALDSLTAFAEAFEAEYPGIDVEVVRGVDSELSSTIETEQQTGNKTADLFVATDVAWIESHAADGWFVEPVGPHATGVEGEYDAEQYIHDGNQFEVGAAVLSYGWNTDLYADGVSGYEDLLDPALAGGKIGVIDPSISASVVDFYLWLEDTFGEQYVVDLAAQAPRIYPSALPMSEATISGEIYAGVFVAPAVIEPAKADGAPVEFDIDDAGAWGARFFGMILDGAPHPNAAQLLADFMVTPEGQELVQAGGGAVLDGVPGTLITNDRVRAQDMSRLTPDAVAAFNEKWVDLFQ
jgi:iron(III) transport system substrate-binding protein